MNTLSAYVEILTGAGPVPAWPEAFAGTGEDLSVLRTGCGFVALAGYGLVRVHGKDAPDLLHRITMNEMRNLPPYAAVVNGFPDPKGKLVDAVLQIAREADTLLLTGPQRTEILSGWIDRYVFIEDVKIEDAGAEFAFVWAGGPGAAAAIGAHSSPGTFEKVAPFGIPARAMPAGGLFPPGFLVMVERARLADLLSGMQKNGACEPVGLSAFDAVRVSAGVPAWDREITPDVNPYEAGLKAFISYTKGCFTGQEVIARLDTYDKVRFFFTRLTIADGPVDAPQTLFADGKDAGVITSCTIDPDRQDAGLALGRIKRKFLRENSSFAVGGADSAVLAKVADKINVS